MKYQTKKKLWDAAFIAPGLLLFFLFTYYPLLVNMFYSVMDWNGLSTEKTFVGFDNFLQVFQDKSVLQAIYNTLYLAISTLVLGLVLKMLCALILHSKIKGHNVLKVILYIPAVLSPVVMSYTWMQFLQYTGVVNQFLGVIGLGSYKENWLLNQDTVKNWLCIISTMQWLGSGMLFFLTGLNGISREVMEAAELDGARGIRKFTRITLPLIMPSITVTMFMSISSSLQLYALPMTLTGGGPNDASMTVSMAIYKQAFGFRRFGYASAISILFFIFIAVVTCIQLRITRKREVEY